MGRESSPALSDQIGSRSHGEGALFRAGVHLSVTSPPSLEVGESGMWGVNAEWDDSSGSGRALGALTDPPAWAQPRSQEPSQRTEDAGQGQAAGAGSALGLCLAEKRSG